MTDKAPTHEVVRTAGGFGVCNLKSGCVYGDFDTREEAEEAIAASRKAQLGMGAGE